MKTYPLPKGATLFRRITKRSIGNWYPMTYDAWCARLGVRWLRVHKGMGNQNSTSDHPADDWVADIAGVCIAVHSYNWNAENFGENFGSFDKAIKAQLERGLKNATREREKLTGKLATINAAIDRLTVAVS